MRKRRARGVSVASGTLESVVDSRVVDSRAGVDSGVRASVALATSDPVTWAAEASVTTWKGRGQ
jgi:hypothetical protein